MSEIPQNGKKFVLFFVIILAGMTGLGFAQDIETLIRQANEFQAGAKADSALVLFRLAMSSPGKSTSATLRCMNGIADNLVHKGHLDSARVILAEAMAIGEAAKEDVEVELSQTYSTLALVMAYREMESPRAVEYARRASKLRQKRYGEESPNTARCYYVLGYAFKKAGMYDSALVYLYKTLDIQKRSGDKFKWETLSTTTVLGTVLDNMGRYGEAIVLHKECLKILEASGLGESERAMFCHGYMASSYRSRGEIREALAHAEKSLALSVGLHGPRALYTSGCYGLLGEILAETGDYERAFDFCERALSIADAAEGAQLSGIVNVCRMLSLIERGRGQPARALPYALRGLEIAQKIPAGVGPETALLLDEVALVYSSLGDDERALAYCRRSIGVKMALSKGVSTLDVAATHLHMARVFLQSGAHDSASAHLLRSEQILRASPDRNDLLEGRLWALRGELDFAAGRYRAALDCAQKSICAIVPEFHGGSFTENPIRPGIETGDFLLEVLTTKALALQKLAAKGETAFGVAALSTLDCAADIAQRMQRSFRLEGSKLSLRERTAILYRTGVECGASLFEATRDQRFAEWAFRFAERSKAGVLAENLERLDAHEYSGIPDSVREKERLIVAGIRTCELSVEKAMMNPGTVSADESQARLFALRQELTGLQEEDEKRYPGSFPVDGKSHIPAVTDLRKILEPDVAVIEFAKTDGRLAIFVVRRDTFQMFFGPWSAELGEHVRSMRRSIKTVDWNRFLADAGTLYTELISPIVHLLNPVMRLVIIPDEELGLLPFEALVPPLAARRPGANNFASLPYLITSHDISYTPSAALYARRYDRRHAETRRSFAGFAPVFRDSTADGKHQPALIAALRSIHVDGKEFSELRYSEEEVRSILAGFRQSGSEGTAYINEAATKAELLRALGKNTHIHVATHGFANDSLPGLSGLVFAAPAQSGIQDDHILYARETYGLRSEADLLVLSACETGLGRIVRGEGVIALTRGFLSAGVHNVVYSLWRVMDRPSSELMIRFYRHMQPGIRYEGALRRAKLDMIRTPETAFPYHSP